MNEFTGLLRKKHEYGQGGYRADVKLLQLRNSFVNWWRNPSYFSRSEKQAVINELHSISSPARSWDIHELVGSKKRLWTEHVTGVDDVIANTLTYKGKVFPVAEVNYLLWGLVNHLAFEDGIAVAQTNFDSVIRKVELYRVALGGIFATQQFLSLKPDIETISGKIAWAAYGWNWVTNIDPPLPTEEAIQNARPDTVLWPHGMTAHAGDFTAGA
ncbi:MAG: hypothetical protein GX575_19780 [Candidatus Anammoximicrobium sp.]|nr:hypothetical protein [Candidatus Anammoximicrobium sp.]